MTASGAPTSRAARACAACLTASPRSMGRCRWRARSAAGRTCTPRFPAAVDGRRPRGAWWRCAAAETALPPELPLQQHRPRRLPPTRPRVCRVRRGVVRVGEHPHVVAPRLPGCRRQGLHQRAAHAAPARRLVDAELVEEHLGPLVGVGQLDAGDEPDGCAGVVGDEQVIDGLGEEALGRLGLRRCVEQPARGVHRLLVAGPQAAHLDVHARKLLRGLHGAEDVALGVLEVGEGADVLELLAIDDLLATRLGYRRLDRAEVVDAYGAHEGGDRRAVDGAAALDDGAVDARLAVRAGGDQAVVDRSALPALDLPVEDALVEALRAVGIGSVDLEVHDAAHRREPIPSTPWRGCDDRCARREAFSCATGRWRSSTVPSTTTGRCPRASSTRARAGRTPPFARCARRPAIAVPCARSSARWSTPTPRDAPRPCATGAWTCSTASSRPTTRSTSCAGWASTTRWRV